MAVNSNTFLVGFCFSFFSKGIRIWSQRPDPTLYSQRNGIESWTNHFSTLSCSGGRKCAMIMSRKRGKIYFLWLQVGTNHMDGYHETVL